ncbi:MAG: hypothetical protein HY454_00620 [Parcubacteria group bacterium]|nr:hypothetical protein [Parcubacteria group bacterium]
MSKKILLRDTGVYIVGMAVLILAIFGLFWLSQTMWASFGSVWVLLAMGGIALEGLVIAASVILLSVWYGFGWREFIHLHLARRG